VNKRGQIMKTYMGIVLINNIRWASPRLFPRQIILLVILSAVWPGPIFATEAVEPSADQSNDKAVGESAEQPPAPAEGKRGPVRSLVQGATPEEHARLVEERKHLSAEAAAFGTDPTALNGYFELTYGHNEYTNNLRLDTATAEARLPITPNLIFRVTMPYAWADLNGPGGFTKNGLSDMTVRAGGRLYASNIVALFVGADATFPTASEKQLGTGKYTLGPGGALAVPLARVRSLFFVVVQDFYSIGGDPSRADVHFIRVQPAVNTIWSERWWTIVSATWNIDDRSTGRKSTLNLLGEIGHNFNQHWNVFAAAGAGVAGKDTPLGLDWVAQAGVRWMFPGTFISKTLFGGFKGD